MKLIRLILLIIGLAGSTALAEEGSDYFSSMHQYWSELSKEEPLKQSAAPEAYRLIYLPSGMARGHAYSVTLSIGSSGAKISETTMLRPGGPEVSRTTREISKALFRKTAKTLQDHGFWAITNSNPIGLDGVTYLIIGKKGEDLRVVGRWSPEPESNFMKLVSTLSQFKGKSTEATAN